MLPLDLVDDCNLSQKYIDHNKFYKQDTFILYGFNIKNRYDEERHLIDESLSPIRVNFNDKNYYGTLVTGNFTFSKLIGHLINQDVDFKTYRRIFSEYDISTQNSYENFEPGLYPVDDVETVSNTKYISDMFYSRKEIPFYQRISGINTYIFCR